MYFAHNNDRAELFLMFIRDFASPELRLAFLEYTKKNVELRHVLI